MMLANIGQEIVDIATNVGVRGLDASNNLLYERKLAISEDTQKS